MFYFDLTAVTLCILEGVDCVAVELYPVIKKGVSAILST